MCTDKEAKMSVWFFFSLKIYVIITIFCILRIIELAIVQANKYCLLLNVQGSRMQKKSVNGNGVWEIINNLPYSRTSEKVYVL